MAECTTFTTNLGDSRNRNDSSSSNPNPSNEGTIYHIMLEPPSFPDLIAYGPFENIEVTVPQVVNTLKQLNPQAVSAFAEVLEQWRNGAVQQFNAPIGDGKYIKIRLVKERNPEAAASLPAPSWVVRRSELELVGEGKVTDFDIVGTFLQKDQASSAARTQLSEYIRAASVAE